MMERSDANVGWGDPEETTPRRRVPGWAWWSCGGGCLVMVLLGAALAVYGLHLTRQGMDPEIQWPRLRRVLAFEERPEGLEIEMGLSLGADQFRLIDGAKGQLATLIEFPAAARSRYEELLDPEQELPLGIGQPLEPEAGELEVQGRIVKCLRFAGMKRETDPGYGAGIRLDLTGSREKPRTLEIRHSSTERVEDAEVSAFLAPFDVWKEHQ